jgi:hypothetical protein
MFDPPPAASDGEIRSGWETASKETTNEGYTNSAGNCRRLVFSSDLHPAETGNIHLTEKFLSGDKQL